MEYKYKLDHQAIAKRIKSARRSAQITQADLAEKVNISTNAIAKMETNQMNVSLQTLINIANVLDIDMNYLLSDESAVDSKDEDIFLEKTIRNLSARDKAFIIHMINGLKTYKAGGEGQG